LFRRFRNFVFATLCPASISPHLYVRRRFSAPLLSIIIAGNSEKEKRLPVGKDDRACFANALASKPLAGTARQDFSPVQRGGISTTFHSCQNLALGDS
jgi:hypothetical protein